MKKFVSIFILFAYLVLLLAPGLPYLYSIAYNHLNKSNKISMVFMDSSESMIGDECYLKAILERAVEDSKAGTPPAPVNPGPEVNNLTCLSEDIFSYIYIDTDTSFQYLQYSFSVKEAIREIHSPPPELIT